MQLANRAARSPVDRSFGAMLRSMGKAGIGRPTTNFGACRDLYGRRCVLTHAESLRFTCRDPTRLVCAGCGT